MESPFRLGGLWTAFRWSAGRWRPAWRPPVESGNKRFRAAIPPPPGAETMEKIKIRLMALVSRHDRGHRPAQQTTAPFLAPAGTPRATHRLHQDHTYRRRLTRPIQPPPPLRYTLIAPFDRLGSGGCRLLSPVGRSRRSSSFTGWPRCWS